MMGGSRGSSFSASPFASMIMGGSRGGRSLFDDPFFGGSMMGPNDSFFGSGGHPFAMMQQSMIGGGGMNGTMSSFNITSSTSNFSGIGCGGGISTSTTTRIVNGRRQSVRETIIQKPDGTIESQVERKRKNEAAGIGDVK